MRNLEECSLVIGGININNDDFCIGMLGDYGFKGTQESLDMCTYAIPSKYISLTSCVGELKGLIGDLVLNGFDVEIKENDAKRASKAGRA